MADTTNQVITCRAAVAWAVNQPIVIETVEVAPPKAGEVRIKILYSGVCHTDDSALRGTISFAQFPCILGHEGGGIVESVGKGVTAVKPGDHVLPLFGAQCNKCKFCKSGKTNLCEEEYILRKNGICFMPDGTSRISCKGQVIYTFFGCSTFSEYAVVLESQCAKISPTAPFEKVCLLACGITTGFGAAVNTANVQPGSSCAIWGMGSVGLATVMGCQFAGAKKIIGIDINAEKQQVAKQFGATDFINPLTDIPEGKTIIDILREMTDGGCDFTFECCGNVKVMKQAYESLHCGWGVVTIVGVAPSGQEFSFDPLHLLMGLKVQGSAFGGYKLDMIPGLVDLYLKKKIKLDEFITHNLSLPSINEAFDLLHSGKCIKAVIKISE